MAGFRGLIRIVVFDYLIVVNNGKIYILECFTTIYGENKFGRACKQGKDS